MAIRPPTGTDEQREALDQLLREAPLDLGGVKEPQRKIVEEMLTAIPLPDDVRTTETTLGSVARSASRQPAHGRIE